MEKRFCLDWNVESGSLNQMLEWCNTGSPQPAPHFPLILLWGWIIQKLFQKWSYKSKNLYSLASECNSIWFVWKSPLTEPFMEQHKTMWSDLQFLCLSQQMDAFFMTQSKVCDSFSDVLVLEECFVSICIFCVFFMSQCAAIKEIHKCFDAAGVPLH